MMVMHGGVRRSRIMRWRGREGELVPPSVGSALVAHWCWTSVHGPPSIGPPSGYY